MVTPTSIADVRDLLDKARQAFGPTSREVLEACTARNVSPDQTQEGMRLRPDPAVYQQLALEKLASIVSELVEE
jgi:predicted HicB family RNase H-like nuclease